MRKMIDWLVFIMLWAIAAGIIWGLVELARAHFLIGMAGFALYFVIGHFLLKLLGYERGIFTSEPPAQ